VSPSSIKKIKLRPSRKKGHRLVIDLLHKKANKRTKRNTTKKTYRTKKPKKYSTKNFIVAIDAGHGGKDPGAVGRKGTHEKTVVLSIAKKLNNLFAQQKGISSFLTRSNNKYLTLRERISRARRMNADIFISIHADSVKNRKAKGASVYVLSNKGASSEAARWLAKKENSFDLAGSINLKYKDPVLASVLIDLSQTTTRNLSYSLASSVLKNIKKITPLHKKTVQKAGFVVLKSPDIPSILVETAFISNFNEEKRLNSRYFQNKIASSIYDGVLSYFKVKKTYRKKIYKKKKKVKYHLVKNGESLSYIAVKYKKSIKYIKRKNKLKRNTIFIGQKILI